MAILSSLLYRHRGRIVLVLLRWLVLWWGRDSRRWGRGARLLIRMPKQVSSSLHSEATSEYL